MSRKKELLKKINKYIQDYNNDNGIKQGILFLMKDKDFTSLKKHRNTLLKKTQDVLKEEQKRLNELKTYSFLYKVAKDIVAEKADKLVKIQNRIKSDNVSPALKDEFLREEDKIYQKLLEIYGMIKAIQENREMDLPELKTEIVSILALGYNLAEDREIFLYLLRDINEDKEIDFKKIENFIDENKILFKIDEYDKKIEKDFEREKVEKERTKDSYSIGR